MTDKSKLIKAVVLGIVILFLVFTLSPFVQINPGERGVVTRFGAVQDEVMGEGLHFRIPIVEKVVSVDVKTQKLEVDAPSYSKDLQNVETKIALNFHLEPNAVQKLWQEIGSDYEFRIIAPAIQESVKAATAQFTAAELIVERPRVKDEIMQALITRLGPRHITVDDFSIINFDFADSYEDAVEQKQVAQQNALKAENDLKRIQIEAEQRIAQAKAEAEAIRIQTEALRENQNLIKLEAVKKWNGVLPQYMLGDSVPL
ncbi:MAG: prohibitin family protein, partial [Deltaproteobacteria bacterium]|nr:prohibitin family protein [Deltaproteobacteria bacterium]